MVHTRSDIIATLRSRNVKGSLTKMKRAELLELMHKTAPPSSSPRDVQRQGIYLAPDPLEKQTGGHAYNMDGTLSASSRNDDAKHTHEKKSWPSDDAPKQKGSGDKPKRGRGDNVYTRFVQAEMRRNGGKMADAAKAWREHKQSGGHYARKDGTVPISESKKYKHVHPGPNPSTDEAAKPTKRAEPTPKPKADPKPASKPKADPKPASKPKADPKPAPKPKADPKPTPRAKRKPRGDQSIFDAPVEKSAPKAKVVDRRAETAARREAEAARKTPRKARKAPDPVVTVARKRLRADDYSRYGNLAQYKRIEDQLTVSNKQKPTRELVKDTQRLRKDLAASKSAREEAERNARASMSLESSRRAERVTRAGKVPRQQTGSGDNSEQMGSGHFWHDVWDDTKDIAEAGAMVGLGALTGGAADAVFGGFGALAEAGGEALFGDAAAAAGKAVTSVASTAASTVEDAASSLASGAERAISSATGDTLDALSGQARGMAKSASDAVQSTGASVSRALGIDDTIPSVDAGAGRQSFRIDDASVDGTSQPSTDTPETTQPSVDTAETSADTPQDEGLWDGTMIDKHLHRMNVDPTSTEVPRKLRYKTDGNGRKFLNFTAHSYMFDRDAMMTDDAIDSFENQLDAFNDSKFKQEHPDAQMLRVFNDDTGVAEDRVYARPPRTKRALERIGNVSLDDMRAASRNVGTDDPPVSQGAQEARSVIREGTVDDNRAAFDGSPRRPPTPEPEPETEPVLDAQIPRPSTPQRSFGTQTDDMEGPSHGGSTAIDRNTEALERNTRAIREGKAKTPESKTDTPDKATRATPSKRKDWYDRILPADVPEEFQSASYKTDTRRNPFYRGGQYTYRKGFETVSKVRAEGLKEVSKEAAKLYAAGEVEAKVEHHLKQGDQSPPGPAGDTGVTDELKREELEREAELRAAGATRMYSDNLHALNPYMQ